MTLSYSSDGIIVIRITLLLETLKTRKPYLKDWTAVNKDTYFSETEVRQGQSNELPQFTVLKAFLCDGTEKGNTDRTCLPP